MAAAAIRALLLNLHQHMRLGESARFLRAHRAWLRRLLTRTFTPEPLLRQLVDPGPGVPGVHFYTFNELERTERWRRETLARLGAAV